LTGIERMMLNKVSLSSAMAGLNLVKLADGQRVDRGLLFGAIAYPYTRHRR
jgi:hypothetical protein